MRKVPLSCEKCGNRNYHVPKSSQHTTRLELKKFCATCQTHTLHKESK
ncbi:MULTISPECIES: 50S ribosomal protein L33 [Staphylococcus]|uniref:Large ribosomal subunit protein bL33 n=1 Tax=Staphylococcus chromogenes TaxID=46126 RepID=A0AAX0ZFC1_STACR|nr:MULTISPECIES: 50S ribosomal protein L33 [Staphylococcus]RIL92920.1 50S ribosomal protein L33 [Staphylococcus equorum]KDP14041.1 50S ribosomal protein L33 [Staphylococcus chromogenes MU 970]MBP0046758.1 50S ribosomal protein L33 [Staphylococcus chromogenes]MBV5138777.1 50S ribosomal protein L33 [Staphylococcus chromogenes]MBW6088104.1 50S ribosomal protein L33 [Staphylococcus chromogenes]